MGSKRIPGLNSLDFGLPAMGPEPGNSCRLTWEALKKSEQFGGVSIPIISRAANLRRPFWLSSRVAIRMVCWGGLGQVSVGSRMVWRRDILQLAGKPSRNAHGMAP